MLGSRAIYHDGWKAVTFKPLAAMYDDGIDPDAPFEDDRWELYHVAEDFSECVDLAAVEPERLSTMVDLWWNEARTHQVLPLDNRPLAALLNPPPRRGDDRVRFTYFAGGAPVPESVAVNIRNRSHAIAIDVEFDLDLDPDESRVPEGVLLAQGSVLGGWTLFVLAGVVHYEHNIAGKVSHSVVADRPLSGGPTTIGFEFTKTAEFAGLGRLMLDGVVVGEGEIPFTTPARFSITGSGLTCGYEVGPAVSSLYEAPFRCNGVIVRTVVDVSGQPYRDLAAELAAILSEQ
jgi:arylsulfatase